MNLQTQEPICSLCGHQCAEVKILDCGCHAHVRCLPVHIFSAYRQAVAYQQQDSVHIPCPACNKKVNGFYIHPLSPSDLEVAGRLNRSEYQGDLISDNSKKRKRGSFSDNSDDYDQSSGKAEEEFTSASASPFLLWSNASVQEKDQNDKLHFRTGRWSTAETKFVEALIKCFDNSTLPLPHGIKLNEFLKDILMCKSSRLTKKMKNAKLSHRNYKLIMATPANHDIKAVSEAQQQFLDSVPSQVTRLILKFNISRIWRLHFSNLCLQTGYESLMGEDWLQSLEDFDKRVSDAESIVRRYRRERLIKALRSDSFQDSIEGVYIANNPNIPGVTAKKGLPRISSGVALSTLHSHLPNATAATTATAADTTTPKEMTALIKSPNQPGQQNQNNATYVTEESFILDETAKKPAVGQEFDANEIPRDLTITTIKLKDPSEMSKRGSDNFSIDFLDDLDGSLSGETYLSLKDTRQSFRKKNIFLSQIMCFLESQNLPIHYVDCWVPSDHIPDEQRQSSGQHANQFQLPRRLVHAGDDLRSDLSSITEYQLHEFGVYSKKFSFDPGAGLPGRCYSSMTYSWENNIQHASPEHFKRLGGARYAGIMTAIGLPVQYPKVGIIVIGLYSLMNVNFNSQILQLCSEEFKKFNPEARWNLSLDISSNESANFSERRSSAGDLSNQESSTSGFQTDYALKDSPANNSANNSKDSESVSSTDSVTQDQVMEIANLLAEHIPSVQEAHNKSDIIRSLRMQLLNFPDNIPKSALNKFKILWRSYKSYCNVQRKKGDIVKLIISDWEFMSKDYDQTSTPWGSNGMTHVNYSVKESNQAINMVTPMSIGLPNHDYNNNGMTSKVLSANIMNFPPALGGSIEHDSDKKLPAVPSPNGNHSTSSQAHEIVPISIGQAHSTKVEEEEKAHHITS